MALISFRAGLPLKILDTLISFVQWNKSKLFRGTPALASNFAKKYRKLIIIIVVNIYKEKCKCPGLIPSVGITFINIFLCRIVHFVYLTLIFFKNTFALWIKDITHSLIYNRTRHSCTNRPRNSIRNWNSELQKANITPTSECLVSPLCHAEENKWLIKSAYIKFNYV